VAENLGIFLGVLGIACFVLCLLGLTCELIENWDRRHMFKNYIDTDESV